MNINHIVCVRSNWFAEIKTGTIIGKCQRISSAHYQRTWQFLKAEEFRRNWKYNKEYRLHVACQFCML